MFFTPNLIVEEALRDADGECSHSTALLEGIDMNWRGNPGREKDYFRLQELLESVRSLGWDGPTELVPRPRLSELETVIATIDAWPGQRELNPIRERLMRALSILTECAETVGVSDTGLASSA